MKTKLPQNLTAILSLAVLLSACGGNRTVANPDLMPTPIEVRVVVPYDCGVPPAIDPVTMRDIEWDIQNVNGVALYTLSVNDYQMLGLNTSDWIAASKQLKAQRNHYRNCIARSKESTDENQP